MTHQRSKNPVTSPYRQAERRGLFDQNWSKLKATDFDGEPVAIRDGRGRPVIRRPQRSVLRSMARQASKRQWHDRRQKERRLA